MNLAMAKESFGLLKLVKAVIADWKERNFTALGTAIGVLIVALVHFARSFGYALPIDIDHDTATRIGIGVAALCSALHVGAPAGASGAVAAAVAGQAGDGAATRDPHATAPVGSQPADAGAAAAVRPVGDGSTDAGGYLRG